MKGQSNVVVIPLRVFFGILVVFIAWVWFYLFQIVPMMNAWLAQYIPSYPALLHLFPLLGVPILIMASVGKIRQRAKAGTQDVPP